MRREILLAVAVMSLATASAPTRAADIADFHTWTEAHDPPHPGLTGSVDSASQVSLEASGAIPAGVDIGYQSVNGADVGASTSGYYFPLSESFQVAVDFDVAAVDSAGLAVVGMGIGEDAGGANSAGAALAVNNGAPFAFSGGARINDVTQPPGLLSLPPSTSGRFFVGYEHTSGDITVGVSSTPGAASPDAQGTFGAGEAQGQWNGDDLLVSFFLRSDAAPPLFPEPLTSGTVSAVFSNFEVLSGSPTRAVPEPGAAGLAMLCAASVAARRRRR